MTTAPLDLHREVSKAQEGPMETISTFRMVAIFSFGGVAIFAALFAFFFSLAGF